MVALVVSGSSERRALVARALGPAWTVHEAGDGLEATRMCLADETIGVVVADGISQPMGAFALSRELKNMQDAPAIIVVLDRPQDRWLAKESKVDETLLNPLDPFALTSIARRLWADRVHGSPAGV